MVRGGDQRSIVKDHTFALFIFGTLPLVKHNFDLGAIPDYNSI